MDYARGRLDAGSGGGVPVMRAADGVVRAPRKASDATRRFTAAARRVVFRRKTCSTRQGRMGNNDLVGKQECLKAIKEFNRETARYGSLVVALGSIHDTDYLRSELKKARKKAYELAKQNKVKLLPHLRGNQCNKDEIEEYEKLWNMFASCLELLEKLLCKTVQLERQFPIHTGVVVFVRTGLVGPVLGSRYKSRMSIVPMDSSSGTSRQFELDEQHLLQRDICDIRSMLVEIHEIVDIKPWAIEPVMTAQGIAAESEQSLKSISSASTAEVVSVYGHERHRRRRCMCLISVSLLVVMGLGTIIGVSVGLLV